MSEILDHTLESHQIYADWLDDHGKESQAWRNGVATYIGFGSGSGSGSISEINILKGNEMQIGKAYLVHCGDWHTFVGRLVEASTPLLYRFESVSKISDTNNGDCWFDLASGEDKKMRAGATYVHCKQSVLLPVSIAAIEWAGKTPQEAEL